MPRHQVYSDQDLRQFLTILLAHRILQSSNSGLCLNLSHLSKAVSKLLCQEPIRTHAPTEFVYLERLLRVLVEALLSLSKETFTLSHKVGVAWYAAINDLFDVYVRIVAQKPVELEVERWNVAFLLIHCQNLFLTFKDCYSPAERVLEMGERLADTVMEFYGGQHVRGKETLKQLLRLRRDRVKWHKDYLHLEDRVFDMMSATLMGEHHVERSEQEGQVASKIRDQLDKELGQVHNVETIKAAWGAVTRVTNHMGPYEENDDYFALGLLDLCYRLGFYTSNFDACFRELIGAVHSSLHRPSSDCLHHKAVAIYRTICSLEKGSGVKYGEPDDRKSIELWLEKSKYPSDDVHRKAAEQYELAV
jgi:hypothetical protein